MTFNLSKDITVKMKKLGLTIGILTLSTASFADTYQFELSGGLSKVNIDYGFGETELDDTILTGQFLFSPVETGAKPLAEATYLAKANNIKLIHLMLDNDSDTTYDIAQAEFYVPQTNLYIAPFYIYSSSEYDGEKESDNNYGFNIGFTPMEGMRLSTFWIDDIDYELNIDFKYVKQLDNNNAFNLQLAFAKAEDDEFYDQDDYVGLEFDYFFNPTTSIGIEYHSTVSAKKVLTEGFLILGEDSIGIRAEKFFNDTWSMQANYYTSDDIDSWRLGISFRF